MTRPYVQISAENQIDTLRAHLQRMLPRFVAIDGVLGVTLNGGLSRGYADHLSEIDVTLFLASAAYHTWQQDKFPVALGITVLDGQLYDIKIVDIAAEEQRAWEDVALWDASYAQILYDPEGRVQRMFEEKLAQRPDPAAAAGPMMGCWWHFELAAEIWIHRGDVLQGHQMLNQAVDNLVQALFLANREYIPHEKWLLHMSRSLAWQPADWNNRLRAALSTGEMDMESVRTRQTIIRQLWTEVDDSIRATFFPDLPVRMMQKSTFDSLKQLVDNSPISVADWQAQTGSGLPNRDPFHPLFRIEDGQILLDHAALL